MGTTPRILNVEDDSPSRFLKSRILERAGFQVVEAETAADAIHSAAQEELRLVLLDLRLPDGDGFQVCESIKATRPELPVVMITSTYCTAQGRQDGLDAGADAYLIEPVPPDRLVTVIRRFLEPSQDAPVDLDAWVVTDREGCVVEISGPAHRLLNLSARGALGRNLTAFFTQDRHYVLNGIARAADGQVVERESVLRPRDRRPFPVRIEISRDTDEHASVERLRWILEPLPPNGNGNGNGNGSGQRSGTRRH
jgi:DNA-binding response OmpR family regulator